MGEQNINSQTDQKKRLAYINHLLDDLRSLEHMLQNNTIESGITRLGAEQEFCLVNDYWRPATNAEDILEALNDDYYTTELAKYNIEINLDPFEAKGSVFQKLQSQLDTKLKKVREVAAKHGSKVVLTGILPSIGMSHVSLDYMTPKPRYYALNDQLTGSRGTDFRLRINGVDQLAITHDNVMFEACNTSFQIHLQIDPEDFESSYNWAQAISGPVLAACVNSPLLLGKELWSETRIALFQQSIDTRELFRANIDHQARVSFGEDWVRGSIADHYKSEISRFPVILTRDIDSNSYETLMNGGIPKLQALNLFNGTVYRWNRPCYGVGNGKPHIRIENRYIPSGPSTEDEIANMVFWVGVMAGRREEHEQIWEKMSFKEAKGNFIKAAKHGTEAVMNWMGKRYDVNDLILEELLPICRDGLEKLGIDKADSEHYLAIIEKRLTTHTGAQWIVKNYRNLLTEHSQDHALCILTKETHSNQTEGKPICDWPNINLQQNLKKHTSNVSHIMSTKVITGLEMDSALLTVEFMRWNNIHHLPIIDQHNNLVGLITWSHLDKHKAEIEQSDEILRVKDIMVEDVETVETNTPISEAFATAKRLGIGCLPVLQNEKLVGIITARDLERIENVEGLQ